ncbi:MAG TPA: RtcB family protein [Acidimicrobiales bacterium]|nr:RtcB family protein [Acidimicrobiales bacterium]
MPLRPRLPRAPPRRAGPPRARPLIETRCGLQGPAPYGGPPVRATWLADRAGSLVDEHPGAYKDIHKVMRDQADLVTVRAELRQVVNDKG